MDLIELRKLGGPIFLLCAWLLYKRIPKTPPQRGLVISLCALSLNLVLMFLLVKFLGLFSLVSLPVLALVVIGYSVQFAEEQRLRFSRWRTSKSTSEDRPSP